MLRGDLSSRLIKLDRTFLSNPLIYTLMILLLHEEDGHDNNRNDGHDINELVICHRGEGISNVLAPDNNKCSEVAVAVAAAVAAVDSSTSSSSSSR